MEEEIIKEQEQAQALVKQCLSEDEKCRNNDLWLILQVWQKKQQIKLFVPYNQMREMISPETIVRARRKIQNTNGELLPTLPEVLYKRKVKQEILRRYFSQNQDIIREWEVLAYKLK